MPDDPRTETDDDGKTFSDKMDEAGRPSLTSIIIYFMPLSPMNADVKMWLVSLLPATCSYFMCYAAGTQPPSLLRYALVGDAAGDPALDWRPAWLQAIDCGERIVLLVIHLFVAMFHLQIAAFMGDATGSAMMAEARELAFTDAPKGTAGYDALQWPPGPYLEKPVLYMRFHTLIDVSPLVLMACGLPDLAFMAMLVEKAGGWVDHLYMYGGTLTERLKTLYPIMLALCLRLPLLMLGRAAPSGYLSGALGTTTTTVSPSAMLADGLAHVLGAVLVGVALRPLGWAVCGAKPACRGRPGRAQTPWKSKAK